MDLDLAAESQDYCDELTGRCAEHGLTITELSTHLQGQLVAVHPAYDDLFDAFAPEQVHGKPKEIQSLDGGVVAELMVRDGDIVAAGDRLMRLDPTVLEVNLDIARGQLAAALALRARLQAEQVQAETLSFDYVDVPFAPLDVARHEKGQREIFAARAAVRKGQRAQLHEAQQQFDSQAKGIDGQIDALEDQITLLDKDLVSMRDLASKGLTRQSQISELKRSKSQLVGQLAGLSAERAQLANARRESELSVLQAERSFLEEVVTQLREASSLVEELTLQIVTHESQLARIDILAPAAGIVHQLQVTTLGGVVVPGETIAQIVPLDEGMDFELRVDPRNIDQVHPGQVARIVISSFDPQTTPQLDARVASVSPGVITDPNTGQVFYRVSLALPPQELELLGSAKLMPGMPVEAYLETGDRSVLSYLLHPVTSHLRRALRG
jgi:HlyD family secretion protein